MLLRHIRKYETQAASTRGRFRAAGVEAVLRSDITFRSSDTPRRKVPIVRGMAFAQGMIVRLLRLWSATVARGDAPMPVMVGAVVPLGIPAEAGIAAASLFELVEARLGRPLQPECCCSRTLSADEQAMLGLIDFAPATLGTHGSATIPHGLPAVVGWAAMALRRTLGMGADAMGADGMRGKGGCPFGAARAAAS